MKDTTLHTRVNSEDKMQAEAILKSLGLDLSTAIDIYLKQIVRAKGLPFPIIKEVKMIEQIKASMAMEGMYLTNDEVESLKQYRGDGSEHDQKMIHEILEKYREE